MLNFICQLILPVMMFHVLKKRYSTPADITFFMIFKNLGILMIPVILAQIFVPHKYLSALEPVGMDCYFYFFLFALIVRQLDKKIEEQKQV